MALTAGREGIRTDRSLEKLGDDGGRSHGYEAQKQTDGWSGQEVLLKMSWRFVVEPGRSGRVEKGLGHGMRTSDDRKTVTQQ